jgi:hypothetical protein
MKIFIIFIILIVLIPPFIVSADKNPRQSADKNQKHPIDR